VAMFIQSEKTLLMTLLKSILNINFIIVEYFEKLTGALSTHVYFLRTACRYTMYVLSFTRRDSDARRSLCHRVTFREAIVTNQKIIFYDYYN